MFEGKTLLITGGTGSFGNAVLDGFLNTEVKELITENNIIRGVRLHDGATDNGDSVIVATGGFSYQATGSTGDGYRWAKKT